MMSGKELARILVIGLVVVLTVAERGWACGFDCCEDNPSCDCPQPCYEISIAIDEQVYLSWKSYVTVSISEEAPEPDGIYVTVTRDDKILWDGLQYSRIVHIDAGETEADPFRITGAQPGQSTLHAEMCGGSITEDATFSVQAQTVTLDIEEADIRMSQFAGATVSLAETVPLDESDYVVVVSVKSQSPPISGDVMFWDNDVQLAPGQGPGYCRAPIQVAFAPGESGAKAFMIGGTQLTDSGYPLTIRAGHSDYVYDEKEREVKPTMTAALSDPTGWVQQNRDYDEGNTYADEPFPDNYGTCSSIEHAGPCAHANCHGGNCCGLNNCVPTMIVTSAGETDNSMTFTLSFAGYQDGEYALSSGQFNCGSCSSPLFTCYFLGIAVWEHLGPTERSWIDPNVWYPAPMGTQKTFTVEGINVNDATCAVISESVSFRNDANSSCTLQHAIPLGGFNVVSVDLDVGEPERTEDDPAASRAFVCLNNDFDEGNEDANGVPVPDNAPPRKIDPSDGDLKPLQLGCRGKGDNGQWSLSYSEGAILIWHEPEAGTWEVVESGAWYDMNKEWNANWGGDFRIEGIQASGALNDVEIVGRIQMEDASGAFEDKVLLTVIETDITVDRDPLPADGETKATVTVVANPSSLDVEWTIEPKELLKSFTVTGPRTAEIVAGTESGVLTITAKVLGFGDGACPVTRQLVIGCACPGCSIGEPDAGLGSVDISFSMGRMADGSAAGRLYLMADEPNEYLATPWSLSYPFRGEGVEIIRHSTHGLLRQVKVPAGLADIYANGPHTMELRFYTAAGEKQGEYYQPVVDPVAVWRVDAPGGDPTKLHLTRVESGQDAETHQYAYTPGTPPSTPSVWTLQSGWSDGQGGVQPLRTETLAGSLKDCGNETLAVKEGDHGAVVYEVYRTAWPSCFAIADYERIGQSTDNPIEISRGFFETPEDPEYGKLMWVDNESDGSWARYLYDDAGRVSDEIRAWNNDYIYTGGPYDPDEARVTHYEYTGVVPGDDGSEEPYRPRTVVEKVDGTAISKTIFGYYTSGNDRYEIVERCATPAAGYGATGNLRTVTIYHAPGSGDWADRVQSIEYPDGRKDAYTYEYGTYTFNEQNPDQSAFAVGSGSDVQTTVTHKVWDQSAYVEVANKTTQDRAVTDAKGNTVLEETFVYDGSGYGTGAANRIGFELRVYDDRGHVTLTHHADGTTSESMWDCCYRLSERDSSGVTTTYNQYDALGRLLQQTRLGVSQFGSYPSQAPIVTTYTYDAMGHVLTTTVSAGGLSRTTTNTYDTAGRLKSTIDPEGIETTHTYATVSGSGRKVTVRRFTGTTKWIDEITEYYRDGRTKKVSVQVPGENAVIQQYYEYGIDSGQQYTTVYTGPDGDASEMWTKTTYDALGRVVSEEKSGFDYGTTEDTVLTTYEYYTDNDAGHKNGQLYRTTTGDLAPTIYVYDEMGSAVRSGVDIGDNDQLDLASADRITESSTAYVQAYDAWWQETTSKVYAVTGSDTAYTTGVTKRRLSGFTISLEGQVRTTVMDESVSVDIAGNETVVTTRLVEHLDGQGSVEHALVERQVDVPDSPADEWAVTRNGLAQTSISRTGVATTFGYDALGRRTTVQAPRHTNPTAMAYDATTGRVTSITDPAGNVTTFGYDSDTGRRTSVTRTVDQSQLVEYTDYTKHGRVRRQWGHTTYPVQYAYDGFGRRTEMRTFRGGTGWTSSTWPEGNEGEPEITTWVYDEATGQVVEKEDDDGKAVTYTYLADGRLETRTWARQVGPSSDLYLITQYLYASNTGELTDIKYWRGADRDLSAGVTPDPDTPWVSFTYNRLGQHATIDDGVGDRTFTYDTDPSATPNVPPTLKLLTESIDGTGGFYDKLITRKYSQVLMAGRDAGFQIGPDAQNPDVDYEVSYIHYDDNGGRFSLIKGPGLPGYGVEYGYEADSDLIDRLEFKVDGDTVPAKADYTYEANRDLVTVVENLVDYSGIPTTISKFDYGQGDGYDEIGRRTQVIRTGAAFTNWMPPLEDGFIDLFGYNDRSELTDTDRHEWTDTGGTGNQLATYGDFVYAYDHIGNRESYTLDQGTATTYTANDLNQYTATAHPTESFSYDADGNLTADGVHAYAWDGENRLICVAPVSPVQGDGMLEFRYDYMGRRVRKVYSIYNGSVWNAERTEQYVYDGWNVVLVLDDANVTQRKYTWGLDLSGTLHGAGGIGGLLAAVETQGTPTTADDEAYWFLYDANGNVWQVLNGTPAYPTIAAKYEYDPYGNVVTSSSGYAATNPIRFSTKWFDTELGGAGVSSAVGTSGLGYWGYRYYSPRLGRWISRDPKEERGGLALYQFARNAATFYIDPDGQQAISTSDMVSPGSQPAPPGSQPAPPSTQPVPPTDNQDPNTYLGNLLAGLSGSTTCSIYVVRVTLAALWPGHTIIVWPTGSLGFGGTGAIGSEQTQIQGINSGGFAVSIYAVDYKPNQTVLEPLEGNEYPWGTNLRGLTTERKIRSAYGAGPKGVKGKCCPDSPNCADIITCLAGHPGKGMSAFKTNAIYAWPGQVNCNSYARFALESCCLKRGALLVNGYTNAYTSVWKPPIGPIYDGEIHNLWGWGNGPSGSRRCDCP